MSTDKSERETFEAEIRKDCGDLSTFGSGKDLHYRNSAVNNAWIGWKARASQPATVVPPFGYVADFEPGGAAWKSSIYSAPDIVKGVVVPLYTHPSAPAESGLTEEQREVLTFLCGTGLLSGCGFGERPKGERGLYWWRSALRSAFPALKAAPSAAQPGGEGGAT